MHAALGQHSAHSVAPHDVTDHASCGDARLQPSAIVERSGPPHLEGDRLVTSHASRLPRASCRFFGMVGTDSHGRDDSLFAEHSAPRIEQVRP
jgi:hypothetical protein